MSDIKYRLRLIPIKTEQHTSTDINDYVTEIKTLVDEFIKENTCKDWFFTNRYTIDNSEDTIELLFWSFDIYKSEDLADWLHNRLNSGEEFQYIIYYAMSIDSNEFYYENIKNQTCIARYYNDECMNFK